MALCGGIVLEEALDLSFDRLLMMMMMMIYINLDSSLRAADNLNTRSCILTTSNVAAK